MRLAAVFGDHGDAVGCSQVGCRLSDDFGAHARHGAQSGMVDVSQVLRIGNQTRIGAINTIDIGIDFTLHSRQCRCHGDGSSVGATPT